jgi:hypothetical protein
MGTLNATSTWRPVIHPAASKDFLMLSGTALIGRGYPIERHFRNWAEADDRGICERKAALDLARPITRQSALPKNSVQNLIIKTAPDSRLLQFLQKDRPSLVPQKAVSDVAISSRLIDNVCTLFPHFKSNIKFFSSRAK